MKDSHAPPVTLLTPEKQSADSVEVSPLSVYSSCQPLDVELRPPHNMPGYHWHSHIEVNIPFGGDVEYIINGQPFVLKQEHIGLFWATIPHRLTDASQSHKMGIINIPIHLFLSWPLSRKLLSQITHGVVLQSASAALVSQFEVARWEKEIALPSPGRQQLVIDEVCLMLKRISLDGWQQLLATRCNKTLKQGASKHSQAYVQQMLAFIASHYNAPLTVKDVADHVGLHANYAMGLFQRVMQLSIKQYITAMRINHARALLSDTDRTILDIAMTAGFNSSSRFYAAFQRFSGVTPSDYRKLSREDHRWFMRGNTPLKNMDKGACDGQRPLVAGVKG